MTVVAALSADESPGELDADTGAAVSRALRRERGVAVDLAPDHIEVRPDSAEEPSA
ncbi:hypothetical protein AB0D97_18535 [Streptomyces roseus]|uniref:hypothetical protein n=1 Tax=Streptomyces roseus TaxID=66430 RepID=UPI003402FE6A